MLRSFESLLAALLALLGLGIFTTGMVLRLVAPQVPSGWTGEITIYLTVWAMLLAAAGCVREGEHIRADFFIGMLGPKKRKLVDFLSSLSSFVFCLVLFWFGWQVVLFAWQMDERSLTMMQTPQYIYYAALPCSMAISCLRYLVEMSQILRRTTT